MLWDADTARLLQTLRGHTCAVTCIDLTKDGKVLVSGGGPDDKTVKVWDLGNINAPRVLHTLKAHVDAVWAVKISPDGMKAASASWDMTVMTWSMQSGEQLRTFRGHKDKVWCVAWSPDSKLIASAGKDSDILVWEADTGMQAREPLRGHSDKGVGCVTFNSTAGMIVSGGFDDCSILVWDLLKDGKATVRPRLQGHTDAVMGLSLSPDDKYVVSGSWDKTVRVWEVATGKLIRMLEGHTDVVKSVVWSRNGQWLVSGSCEETVRKWRIDEQVCN
jgi:WD40 repeat protein